MTMQAPHTRSTLPAIAFVQASEALLGPCWQREVARVLGERHPDGGGDPLDVRMIRRWSNGQRPIPAWVPDALATLLREQAADMEAAARNLDMAPNLF